MLADNICNAGGSAALVEYITESKGNARLPGIMTLGYIAAFDETNAMAIINSKVCIFIFESICFVTVSYFLHNYIILTIF